MRFTNYFLMLMSVCFFLSTPSGFAKKDSPYVVEEKGRSTWRVLFDQKMPTPAEQWEYAHKTQNKGRLKKADRRMLYLVRRWPNSKEAPWAQRARADILYSRGKLKKAFLEYQYLIDNYSSRMLDYSSVLESQFKIAMDVMGRKRMRWFFGGYRAPEYAVGYFEDVIRNGPQWSRASEAQFLIGKAYHESDDLELAISGYSVVGYRYPESPFGEESLWQQIACLVELHKEYPHSIDILDRVLTSTTVFLTSYPTSTRKNKIIQMRNRLYEVKAQKAFDEAEFYVKIPKKPRAAVIYFKMMIEEYPKSKLVPAAEIRISELEARMIFPVVNYAKEQGAEGSVEAAEKEILDEVN
jgi:outer membrane protein assembly factor BamD (BamD/ComL family)